MSDLTSNRTREQEAAICIIDAWDSVVNCAMDGQRVSRPMLEVMRVTYAECARLADDIRGFIPREAQ